MALTDAQKLKHVNLEMLQYAKGKIEQNVANGYVAKKSGYDLSKNDFTDELKTKLDGLEAGGQVNVIEAVQVNGTALSIGDKTVNITVTTGTTNGTLAINGVDVAFYGASDLFSKVATLIGEDASKSARTIANEELAKQLIPASAKESLDTLAEIAAWIQQHPEDASAMNSAIAALQGICAGIGGDEDEFKTITAYVADAISDLDFSNELAKKVDKVDGSRLMTDAEGTKLAGIAEGAQVNVIETVKVNDTALTVTGKTVNIDLSGKVDKETGKSLVADTEIARLAAMSDGANKAEVSAEYTAGLKVATVTIDGNATSIYVPVATAADIDAMFA